MAAKPGQDAKPIRPLWIVANLLLTLAICFLLLVIRKQLTDFHKEETSTTAPTVEGGTAETARTAGREMTRKQPDRTRPKTGIQPTTHALQSPSDASATTPPSPPAPPEGISPQVPVAIIAAAATSASTNRITAITGRITLRGEAPPEEPIDMSAFPPCAKLQTNSPMTRDFVVSKDGGLADVLVSILAGLDRERHSAPKIRHEMVFVNCQIQPSVSAVLAGQALTFKNTDPNAHTVQLVTTNNSQFAQRLSPKSETTSLPLTKAESFLRIECREHPWEFAYVFVVEHPFFAVTDTDGNFVISNVPPGKYTLRASHLRARGTNTIARVTVNPDKISQVNFTFDAPEH